MVAEIEQIGKKTEIPTQKESSTPVETQETSIHSPDAKETTPVSNPIISTDKKDEPITIDELKKYYDEIKITDKTEAEIRELIETGKISKKDVIEAFKSLKKLLKEKNININDVPKEYWQSFIAVNLKHKAGVISDEKYAELKEAFSTESLAKSIEIYLKENSGKISQEEAEKYQKLYATLSHINEAMALEAIDRDKKLSPTEKETKKQKFLERAILAKTKGHKDRLKRLERLITDKTDAKTASAILKSADAYVIEHQNLTENYLVEKNYSSTFIDKIKNIGESILDTVLEFTKKFISDFWETTKGKAIKRELEHQYEETVKAKEEAKKAENKKEEIKVNLNKIKEKIDIAKKKAKVAMEKATEFFKKLGITPSKLTKTEGKNLLAKHSPKLADEFKKAYSQKLTAEKDVRIAGIEDAYAEARLRYRQKVFKMNGIIFGNKLEAALRASSIYTSLS